MKRIVRLTESDLTRIVRRVINESSRQYLMEQETFQMTLTMLYEINPQTKKKEYRDVVRYSIPQSSKGFAATGAQTTQTKDTSQSETKIGKIEFIRFENGSVSVKPASQTLSAGNVTGTFRVTENQNLKNLLLQNINKKYLGDIVYDGGVTKNTQYTITEQQLQPQKPGA